MAIGACHALGQAGTASAIAIITNPLRLALMKQHKPRLLQLSDLTPFALYFDRLGVSWLFGLVVLSGPPLL